MGDAVARRDPEGRVTTYGYDLRRRMVSETDNASETTIYAYDLVRKELYGDPYLPIAACDIAIGIAYTSPVLAARTAGKPGYYLDPLRRAVFPSSPDYKAITLNTADEIVAVVLEAREAADAWLVPAPAVTPPPPHAPFDRRAADPA